jgi:hypothetical protein
MKKTVLVLILSIVLLAVFGTEAKAQIPKEGTTSFTSSYSGTGKVLAMGQERLQMNYEFTGVNIGDTPQDISHAESFHCLGSLHAVKGEYNDASTFCVAIRPDGDQIFSIYKGTGKLGVSGKGTWTIVGSTGKLVGIQGNGEYTEFLLRPAAEGTWQAFNRQKGQYKLP